MKDTFIILAGVLKSVANFLKYQFMRNCLPAVRDVCKIKQKREPWYININSWTISFRDKKVFMVIIFFFFFLLCSAYLEIRKDKHSLKRRSGPLEQNTDSNSRDVNPNKYSSLKILHCFVLMETADWLA